MTVSQQITLIEQDDNAYDDEITITDIPQGQFPAVINLNANGDTREVTVQLMDLQASSGGTMNTNTGLFVRQDGENSIHVKVLDTGGKEVASNTASYPS